MLNRRELLLGISGTLLSPMISSVRTISTEIILLLDCSGSMYTGMSKIEGAELKHYQIQRNGHVQALLSPRVQEVLIRDQVLVRVMVWADFCTELTSRHIITADDVHALAGDIVRLHPTSQLGTGATKHGVAMEKAFSLPISAARRVVDMSTDQVVPSHQKASQFYRSKCQERGYVVNALTIDGSVGAQVANSIRENIVTRTGFLINVRSFENYHQAIEAKLHRELNVA